jgi:hypothetical protein
MEVVKDLVGLDDSDSPEEAIAKLENALAEDAGGHAGERIAELIGLAEAALSVADGFEAVQTLIEALARQQPLILVFDDIHWGEATFLDLVEHLADWTREVPLLLICLARPELLDISIRLGGRETERDDDPARAALRERERRTDRESRQYIARRTGEAAHRRRGGRESTLCRGDARPRR